MTRTRVTLTHLTTGREVPVEVVTVFGRNDRYYRYADGDPRGDRLAAVAEGLAALNYVKIDSDSQISRTHGLLDPAAPGVRDLNSTNGTYLDGVRLPARYGQEGPLVAVSHASTLSLGRQRFTVGLTSISEESLTAQVRAARCAFVGHDHARLPRARALQEFLVERKGFQVRPAVGWPAVIANFYRLQAEAKDDGLAVIVLVCGIAGPELVLGGEPMAFAKLIPLLNGIPGRKVLALEVDGDPTACEEVWKAMAFEDAVLLAAAGAISLDEPVAHTVRSSLIDAVKDSVAGRSVAGVCDDLVDGLEGLIALDTNILRLGWIRSYRGRLSLVFGLREREEDEAISHSLRLGSTTFRF